LNQKTTELAIDCSNSLRKASLKQLKINPQKTCPRSLILEFELGDVHVFCWFSAVVYNLFAIAGRISFIYMKYGRQLAQSTLTAMISNYCQVPTNTKHSNINCVLIL